MLKITKNQGSIQVTADKSGFYPFDGTITFPTNSLFTATSANTDMITFKSTSNGDVQFVGNYKDITISGRSYDTKQKFLTAFSNLANQGSVDAYTKAETDAKIDAKQGKLKAGNGITLTEDATDGTTVVKTNLSMGRGPFNDDGIRIGRKARVVASTGIAFGDESLSQSTGIAIGYQAQSHGTSSIVIGKNSSDQDGATVGTSVGSNVVIGNGARGAGAGVVIGNGARGAGAGVVIGNDSTVDGNGYGYAIGDNVHISETTEMVPIAIGYGAVANETKPLAVTILKITGTDSKGNPELKYCDFIQGDANGKISLLKGDGTDTRMVIQDEIEALKNAGGSGGTVEGLVIDAEKVTAGLDQSVTDSSNLVIIGNKARAYNPQSVVIGTDAKGGGSGSTAIGDKAKCMDDYTIAVGYMATTDGNGTIAIGPNTKIRGFGDVVIGNMANSMGGSGVAIGYNAKSSARYGLSIGYEATTDDTTPLVIKAGKDSNYKPLTVLQSDSTGKLSILKGDGTDERIVIQDALSAGGSGGTVDAYTKTETDNLLNAKQNTLTAGTGITIDENNVISSTGGSGGGANPLVNVKGTESATITDSVTDAVAIGSGAKVSMDYGVSVGYKCETENNSVGIGKNCKALGDFNIAIGNGANTSMFNIGSISIGYEATATETRSIAIGETASVGGEKSIAIGSSIVNNGMECVCVGYSSQAGKTNDSGSTIIGSRADGRSGKYSTLIGSNARSDGYGCTGIGPMARVNETIPLAINAGYKTVDNNKQMLTMIQGDANGKISLLKGDGTDTRIVIQDEITALKAEITTLKAEIAALKGGA